MTIWLRFLLFRLLGVCQHADSRAGTLTQTNKRQIGDTDMKDLRRDSAKSFEENIAQVEKELNKKFGQGTLMILGNEA